MQSITGIVHHGKNLGRTLGFPTANIFCDSQGIASGTRRVNVLVNGEIYQGLGPYFPDRHLFEVHILGFDKEIYEQEVTIYPLKKIRENKKFEHVDALIQQIQEDKNQVLTSTITGMTFGTFDGFHLGHQAYLQQARARCDRLITVIALDETVSHVKGKLPLHSQEQRKVNVAAVGISDVVILGHIENHYQCLIDHQPDVICLGYDQDSFDKGLQRFYSLQGRVLPILVRLEAFSPDIYKSSLRISS